MNRGIDRPTDQILFDEKMAGTDSAVHVDLVTGMRTGGTVAVDGEIIQRDGRFRWEEGFGG
jgi:aminopeptidase